MVPGGWREKKGKERGRGWDERDEVNQEGELCCQVNDSRLLFIATGFPGIQGSAPAWFFFKRGRQKKSEQVTP